MDLVLINWKQQTPELALLTPVELEVLSKRKHSQRSLISRSFLKSQLSDRLKQPPKTIDLTESDNGKLFLKDRSYHFSLAHSGDLMAFLFHPTQPVGIDIETWDRAAQILKISGRYFKQSEQNYMNQDALKQTERALQIWTSKEALLKAEDSNLFSAIELREIDFAEDLAHHRLAKFGHQKVIGSYYLSWSLLN